MKRYLKDLNRRKDLLLYLVTSGLKAQHRNTILGYFWWLLDPILGVLTYYFVIGIVFNRGGQDYVLTLFVGLTVWRWLHSSVIGGARSIISQAGIITQVYLPKAIFPVGAVISQLVNFCLGLIVVIAFLLVFGITPNLHLLWLPYVIVMQLLFTLAIALPLAYLSVFVRDMENVVDHGMRVWFYASPVIWTEAGISGPLQWILRLNPMAHILQSYRSILIHHQGPDATVLLTVGVLSVLVISCTTYLYSQHEHRLIKVL